MKITLKKFQVGGTLPSEEQVQEQVQEQAPVEQQEQPINDQDPIVVLTQVFTQGLQNQDCDLLAQGAQMFLEIVQQMQGGAPEEPQGEPVFRKGGTLVRRIKK